MAITLHRGSIERITIEKDPALKDAKLVLLFEEVGTTTAGFQRHSFDMPDDRALRNLKDDIDTELQRRRAAREEEAKKKPETP